MEFVIPPPAADSRSKARRQQPPEAEDEDRYHRLQQRRQQEQTPVVMSPPAAVGATPTPTRPSRQSHHSSLGGSSIGGYAYADTTITSPSLGRDESLGLASCSSPSYAAAPSMGREGTSYPAAGATTTNDTPVGGDEKVGASSLRYDRLPSERSTRSTKSSVGVLPVSPPVSNGVVGGEAAGELTAAVMKPSCSSKASAQSSVSPSAPAATGGTGTVASNYVYCARCGVRDAPVDHQRCTGHYPVDEWSSRSSAAPSSASVHVVRGVEDPNIGVERNGLSVLGTKHVSSAASLSTASRAATSITGTKSDPKAEAAAAAAEEGRRKEEEVHIVAGGEHDAAAAPHPHQQHHRPLSPSPMRYEVQSSMRSRKDEHQHPAHSSSATGTRRPLFPENNPRISPPRPPRSHQTVTPQDIFLSVPQAGLGGDRSVSPAASACSIAGLPTLHHVVVDVSGQPKEQLVHRHRPDGRPSELWRVSTSPLTAYERRAYARQLTPSPHVRYRSPKGEKGGPQQQEQRAVYHDEDYMPTDDGSASCGTNNSVGIGAGGNGTTSSAAGSGWMAGSSSGVGYEGSHLRSYRTRGGASGGTITTAAAAGQRERSEGTLDESATIQSRLLHPGVQHHQQQQPQSRLPTQSCGTSPLPFPLSPPPTITDDTGVQAGEQTVAGGRWRDTLVVSPQVQTAEMAINTAAAESVPEERRTTCTADATQSDSLSLQFLQEQLRAVSPPRTSTGAGPTEEDHRRKEEELEEEKRRKRVEQEEREKELVDGAARWQQRSLPLSPPTHDASTQRTPIPTPPHEPLPDTSTVAVGRSVPEVPLFAALDAEEGEYDRRKGRLVEKYDQETQLDLARAVVADSSVGPDTPPSAPVPAAELHSTVTQTTEFDTGTPPPSSPPPPTVMTSSTAATAAVDLTTASTSPDPRSHYLFLAEQYEQQQQQREKLRQEGEKESQRSEEEEQQQKQQQAEEEEEEYLQRRAEIDSLRTISELSTKSDEGKGTYSTVGTGTGPRSSSAAARRWRQPPPPPPTAQVELVDTAAGRSYPPTPALQHEDLSLPHRELMSQEELAISEGVGAGDVTGSAGGGDVRVLPPLEEESPRRHRPGDRQQHRQLPPSYTGEEREEQPHDPPGEGVQGVHEEGDDVELDIEVEYDEDSYARAMQQEDLHRSLLAEGVEEEHLSPTPPPPPEEEYEGEEESDVYTSTTGRSAAPPPAGAPLPTRSIHDESESPARVRHEEVPVAVEEEEEEAAVVEAVEPHGTAVARTPAEVAKESLRRAEGVSPPPPRTAAVQEEMMTRPVPIDYRPLKDVLLAEAIDREMVEEMESTFRDRRELSFYTTMPLPPSRAASSEAPPPAPVSQQEDHQPQPQPGEAESEPAPEATTDEQEQEQPSDGPQETHSGGAQEPHHDISRSASAHQEHEDQHQQVEGQGGDQWIGGPVIQTPPTEDGGDSAVPPTNSTTGAVDGGGDAVGAPLVVSGGADDDNRQSSTSESQPSADRQPEAKEQEEHQQQPEQQTAGATGGNASPEPPTTSSDGDGGGSLSPSPSRTVRAPSYRLAPKKSPVGPVNRKSSPRRPPPKRPKALPLPPRQLSAEMSPPRDKIEKKEEQAGQVGASDGSVHPTSSTTTPPRRATQEEEIEEEEAPTTSRVTRTGGGVMQAESPRNDETGDELPASPTPAAEAPPMPLAQARSSKFDEEEEAAFSPSPERGPESDEQQSQPQDESPRKDEELGLGLPSAIRTGTTPPPAARPSAPGRNSLTPPRSRPQARKEEEGSRVVSPPARVSTPDIASSGGSSEAGGDEHHHQRRPPPPRSTPSKHIMEDRHPRRQQPSSEQLDLGSELNSEGDSDVPASESSSRPNGRPTATQPSSTATPTGSGSARPLPADDGGELLRRSSMRPLPSQRFAPRSEMGGGQPSTPPPEEYEAEGQEPPEVVPGTLAAEDQRGKRKSSTRIYNLPELEGSQSGAMEPAAVLASQHQDLHEPVPQQQQEQEEEEQQPQQQIDNESFLVVQVNIFDTLKAYCRSSDHFLCVLAAVQGPLPSYLSESVKNVLTFCVAFYRTAFDVVVTLHDHPGLQQRRDGQGQEEGGEDGRSPSAESRVTTGSASRQRRVHRPSRLDDSLISGTLYTDLLSSMEAEIEVLETKLKSQRAVLRARRQCAIEKFPRPGQKTENHPSSMIAAALPPSQKEAPLYQQQRLSLEQQEESMIGTLNDQLEALDIHNYRPLASRCAFNEVCLLLLHWLQTLVTTNDGGYIEKSVAMPLFTEIVDEVISEIAHRASTTSSSSSSRWSMFDVLPSVAELRSKCTFEFLDSYRHRHGLHVAAYDRLKRLADRGGIMASAFAAQYSTPTSTGDDNDDNILPILHSVFEGHRSEAMLQLIQHLKQMNTRFIETPHFVRDNPSFKSISEAKQDALLEVVSLAEQWKNVAHDYAAKEQQIRTIYSVFQNFYHVSRHSEKTFAEHFVDENETLAKEVRQNELILEQRIRNFELLLAEVELLRKMDNPPNWIPLTNELVLYDEPQGMPERVESTRYSPYAGRRYDLVVQVAKRCDAVGKATMFLLGNMMMHTPMTSSSASSSTAIVGVGAAGRITPPPQTVGQSTTDRRSAQEDEAILGSLSEASRRAKLTDLVNALDVVAAQQQNIRQRLQLVANYSLMTGGSSSAPPPIPQLSVLEESDLPPTVEEEICEDDDTQEPTLAASPPSAFYSAPLAASANSRTPSRAHDAIRTGTPQQLQQQPQRPLPPSYFSPYRSHQRGGGGSEEGDADETKYEKPVTPIERRKREAAAEGRGSVLRTVNVFAPVCEDASIQQQLQQQQYQSPYASAWQEKDHETAQQQQQLMSGEGEEGGVVMPLFQAHMLLSNVRVLQSPGIRCYLRLPVNRSSSNSENGGAVGRRPGGYSFDAARLRLSADLNRLHFIPPESNSPSAIDRRSSYGVLLRELVVWFHSIYRLADEGPNVLPQSSSPSATHSSAGPKEEGHILRLFVIENSGDALLGRGNEPLNFDDDDDDESRSSTLGALNSGANVSTTATGAVLPPDPSRAASTAPPLGISTFDVVFPSASSFNEWAGVVELLWEQRDRLRYLREHLNAGAH